MFYTYIIKSTEHNWFYIGSTKDLKVRFLDHNSRRVKSTKARRPYTLVYYEAYESYSLARKREIELKKHGQKKEVLFRRIGYRK